MLKGFGHKKYLVLTREDLTKQVGGRELRVMLKGFGYKKYLVLTREDLTKQVEGRALRSKTTSAIRQYILGKIACRYIIENCL